MASQLGSPQPWEGKTLNQIHKGLAISDEAFDRWLQLLYFSAIECGKAGEAEGLYWTFNRLRDKVVDPKLKRQLLKEKQKNDIK